MLGVIPLYIYEKYTSYMSIIYIIGNLDQRGKRGTERRKSQERKNELWS